MKRIVRQFTKKELNLLLACVGEQVDAQEDEVRDAKTRRQIKAAKAEFDRLWSLYRKVSEGI